MNRKKLNNVIRDLESLRRRGGIKSSELEEIAKSLGRVRDKRGKEPTWINEQFSELYPLSIPHHSGDLNKFTAKTIIIQLEFDVERWKEFFGDSE